MIELDGRAGRLPPKATAPRAPSLPAAAPSQGFRGLGFVAAWNRKKVFWLPRISLRGIPMGADPNARVTEVRRRFASTSPLFAGTARRDLGASPG